MQTAHVVIGAGYGDEGKGLATDALVRRTGAQLVVRFNGGAQAGHTVVDDTYGRHVFGHVGAGTFAGAQTYLAETFIVNPHLLLKELEALSRQMNTVDLPFIFASPDCRVSTIFDMALNGLVETLRGADRHGSCGVGINETVTRAEHGHGLSLDELVRGGRKYARYHLQDIRNRWIHQRLDMLAISASEAKEAPIFGNLLFNANLDVFAETMMLGMSHLSLVDGDDQYLQHYASQGIVLEGAQGLMLDEDLGHFPHVTRSKTGLPYALRALNELEFTGTVQPIYMTRSYATRHGAGPLNFEGERALTSTVHDETNIPNDWQGTLRMAPLDVMGLCKAIGGDCLRATKNTFIDNEKILEPVLGVTWLDVSGNVTIRGMDGETHTFMNPHDLPSTLSRELGLKTFIRSYGQSHQYVRFTDV